MSSFLRVLSAFVENEECRVETMWVCLFFNTKFLSTVVINLLRYVQNISVRLWLNVVWEAMQKYWQNISWGHIGPSWHQTKQYFKFISLNKGQNFEMTELIDAPISNPLSLFFWALRFCFCPGNWLSWLRISLYYSLRTAKMLEWKFKIGHDQFFCYFFLVYLPWSSNVRRYIT
jgi:hypothetical protein